MTAVFLQAIKAWMIMQKSLIFLLLLMGPQNLQVGVMAIFISYILNKGVKRMKVINFTRGVAYVSIME
jgi:hypothetical protein